jgi:hypothetical protein
MRPERKDCAECGAVRDGVWLREETVLEFPAKAEDALSRPLLRQLPNAAASWTALGEAKFERVASVGNDC